MCKDVQDDYYSAVSDDDDDDGRECVEDEDEGTGEYFGSRQQSNSCNAKSNRSRDRNKYNNSCNSDSNNKHNSSSSSCTVDSKNNSNNGEHVLNNCGTVVQVIENDMLSNNAGRAGDVYRSLRQR
jgi:hypothetical protein